MKEDVCIVLNEREPEKGRAAVLLEEELQKRGLAVSRIEPCPDLYELIVAKDPHILVLDYLLGDFTTGLDILEQLNALEKRPEVYFLTDEPSINVAVTAMKLGAEDYLELENPQSIQKIGKTILEKIKKLHSKKDKKKRQIISQDPSLNQITAQSKKSIEMLEQAYAVTAAPFPIVVILGPAGSGRSFLARAICRSKALQNFIREESLDLYAGSMEDLLGVNCSYPKLYSLGKNLALIVDHAEYDTGELLGFIEENRNIIWPPMTGNVSSYLTIATKSRETANAWVRAFDCPIIEVPPLSERKEDIPPLVQAFLKETGLTGAKSFKIDADLLLWMSELEWIGNIKELRAVTINSLLTSLKSKRNLKEIIEHCKATWEKHSAPQQYKAPDPLTAAIALDLSAQNYRIAALKLGTTPHLLATSLRGVK